MPPVKSNKKKLIVILCPYPYGGAPSQRFRYEQYLSILNKQGWNYQIHSFLDASTNRILYRPGHLLSKIWGIVRGYIARLKHVYLSREADAVFIHRETTPLGPPWVELIIAKILKKPIIYDFDDAIWLSDQSGINNWVSRLKWRSKVAKICHWSYRVSAGNSYLADYAQAFNPNVMINPTTIDTEHYHKKLVDQETEPVAIGWTGSHSTLKYLSLIESPLQSLSNSYHFRLIIIANHPPEFDLPNLEFTQWNQSTEVKDLSKIQIGVMPLLDDPWSQGKCGFKALQYLALGIPAVVSPVGVNQTIVQPNIHGFHATNDEQWYNALEKLLINPKLRHQMGKAGRQHVVDHYSVIANTSNVLNLLPKVD